MSSLYALKLNDKVFSDSEKQQFVLIVLKTTIWDLSEGNDLPWNLLFVVCCVMTHSCEENNFILHGSYKMLIKMHYIRNSFEKKTNKMSLYLIFWKCFMLNIYYIKKIKISRVKRAKWSWLVLNLIDLLR